ncbi:MAG: sulfurtransferase [Candidatus Marinimicrobia bacterium]|nr:sulfurtransferase [Candidatus Neomarinimicrobiota bacterium]
MKLKEISVQDLKEKKDNGENFVLLDVRELFELKKASIQPNTHISMNMIPAKIDELDKKIPIYVICHTGVRSQYVTHFLEQSGFDASNVRGGIHAWSINIDPTVPMY